MYHLRVLSEVDWDSFRALLQQFLSYLLNQEHTAFYTYFNDVYVPHTTCWAFCHRVGTTVNTNMFVEAFHRKLKSVYLAKKQNRRLDKLLYILLKISRDIVFEGLRKQEIGKRTHRKCDLNKRCVEAKKMKEKGIKASLVEENHWSVMSASRSSSSYDVVLCKTTCDCLVKMFQLQSLCTYVLMYLH